VPVKPRKERAARRRKAEGGNRSQEFQRGRMRRRACRAEAL
jgi:hypothetical protein